MPLQEVIIANRGRELVVVCKVQQALTAGQWWGLQVSGPSFTPTPMTTSIPAAYAWHGPLGHHCNSKDSQTARRFSVATAHRPRVCSLMPNKSCKLRTAHILRHHSFTAPGTNSVARVKYTMAQSCAHLGCRLMRGRPHAKDI